MPTYNQVPPARLPRSRYVTARQLQNYITQLQIIVNEALANGSGQVPLEGENYVIEDNILKIKATNGDEVRIDMEPVGSDFQIKLST